jgi:hypothetical protein
MLTFQVLDRGETFYVPLERRPMAIGCEPGCDVRLTEAGVCARHARIEPIEGKAGGRAGDPEVAYKLIDLAAHAGGPATRVNGQEVAQVQLRLGDRVEIGSAVLVLGRQVSRPVTPADLSQEPDLRAWERARPTPRSPARRLVAVGLFLAAAAAGVLFFALRGESLPAEFARIERLRLAGEFQEAAGLVQSLRAGWGIADPARAAQLDRVARHIEDTEATCRELHERMQLGVAGKTYSQQAEELRELRARDPLTADAAQIMLGRLAELRQSILVARETRTPDAPEQGRPDERRSDQEGVERHVRPSRPADQPPATGQPAVVTPPPALATRLQDLVAQADSLQQQRSLGQADAVLTQALDLATAEDLAMLRQRIETLRRQAGEECASAVQRARELAGKGETAAAVALLRECEHRLPPIDAVRALGEEVHRLQAVVDAAAAPLGARKPAIDEQAREQRRRSLAELSQLMDRVRAAERNSDFAAASLLLQQGADQVRERDPLFSDMLRGRSHDLGLIAGLGAEVARRLEGRTPEFTFGGETARLLAAGATGLRLGLADGPRDVTWLDLPPEVAQELGRTLKLEPRALLGFAAVAYRQNARDHAEACLLLALQADATLDGEVQEIIRRGRGDSDRGGYVVVKDRFVARRMLEVEKLSRQLEGRLTRALAVPVAQREKYLDEILAGGPDALDALVLALERKQREIAERTEKHAFKKTWDRLAAQRRDLDKARAHARALIYDEAAYFYPYQPPAVDGAKAAEYAVVQAEVDKRVAAVQALWKQGQVRTRVPAKLFEEAEAYAWIGKVLRDFGVQHDDVDARVQWLRTLPQDLQLSLQNFCLDAKERAELDLWERIETFNVTLCTALPAAERGQVEVTNAYRRSFGHRPLAVSNKLQRASRGHCSEMSRLGYFGHFSPNKERRTPIDRMRLEGYGAGAGENCALNDSPEGAHQAWVHSSGHHRNLLQPSHTEFGSGNDGRYWTQNFGRGQEYLSDPAFPR